MENLKIGITIGLKNPEMDAENNPIHESIWTNGMKINILTLAKMLMKSERKHEIYLLNTIDVDVELVKGAKYLKDVNFCSFEEKYLEMDILICMGTQVEKRYLRKFKSQGPEKKVIAYRCGNNYVIAMEEILFKDGKKSFEYETEFDEMWYVPQQHDTNYGYYHTLHRTEPIAVPFIWDQSYLVESLIEVEKSFQAGNFKKSFKYDQGKAKKVIGVMEPNLNIVKFCLIPSMIAEESYRTPIGKEKIEKLLLTNSLEVGKHGGFASMIATFDLYKGGKVQVDSRYQTAYVLTQFIDVLVCHQILNPLNYLYLDAAYMGYPVLHNAPMCKDLGYYYEGSDTVEGAKMLNWILDYHDDNVSEYAARNAKALWRYSVNNPEVTGAYDSLIDNLYKGGNKGLVYNPETNLYDKKA